MGRKSKNNNLWNIGQISFAKFSDNLGDSTLSRPVNFYGNCSYRIFVKTSLYFSKLGDDPKTGSKFRKRTGGICSAHRVVQNRSRKAAKMYNGVEILVVEFPHLASLAPKPEVNSMKCQICRCALLLLDLVVPVKSP